MTSAQRAEINRENARNSTGPKTDEGKDASRRNSTKHGLTAKVLTLPGENSEDIQEQADAWIEALQPASHDEDVLVDQIALGALKLQRIAKAETEIIAEQVRGAEGQWEVENGDKLLALIKLMRKEPARAVLRLRQFAAGVTWLIGRWDDLKKAFESFDCWDGVPLIEEAIRLSGFDPDRLDEESLDAFGFACRAVACDVENKNDPGQLGLLRKRPNVRWYGIFGDAEFTPEEAREGIRKRIEENLEELQARAESLQEAEQASREGAKVRACVPADTPSNRLFLRYAKSTENGFDRAIKTLAKLQSDRKKAAEKEAESANSSVPRNEAIYESWEVKRAGAENLGRELPHIPLAVGVGRSGPSQTSPAVPVHALPTHIP
jgi:hypothetical protein